MTKFKKAARTVAAMLVLGAAMVHAQEPTLEPQVIDLAALRDADIGPVIQNAGTLRSKTFVSTPEGAVSVQVGDAPRHSHQSSIEIQYVVSGSGTFWVGDSPRQVHAGDLIIIPKGTAHGGSHANSGELKMLVIKLPPQVKGDVQLLP